MSQKPLCLSFLLFSLTLTLPISTAKSNIVYVQCSQLILTSMTPYKSNVDSLFASLADSATIYNFNKFETSTQNDVVYGLFQCRGDLSPPTCKDCVANAVSQLKTTCSMSTGGEIQLDGCFVKYNNTSFFGVQEKMEMYRRCGPSIGYNPNVLNRVDGALAYLVGVNGEYFREGEYGSTQGVAQCVQDLSLSDCQDCLSEAFERLRLECETSAWADMYFGKCYIRYVDQGVANVNMNKPSSDKSSGREKEIWKWIGYILAALFGGTSLTIAGKNCCNVNVIQKLKREAESAIEEKRKVEVEKKKEVEERKKAEEEKKEMESVLRSLPRPFRPQTPTELPPHQYYPYYYYYYYPQSQMQLPSHEHYCSEPNGCHIL